MHRFTLITKSIVLFLLVAVGGLLGFSLLQSESALAAPAASRAAQPTPPPLIFLSSNTNVTVDGVKAANEDILMFNDGTFSLYFDGSDVGLAGADVDAFELTDDGILMSFIAPVRMVVNGTPNTQVDDSDIVKFTFVGTPGTNTSGSFTSCFDGSQFGLTTAGEDIDAIAFDADGRLVISPEGLAKVNGTSLVVADEDLVAFGPGPFSCNPASGSWELIINGTDLALSAAAEDVGGAWIDAASPDENIYLSTKGNFKAVDGFNAISGDADDIFGFSPTELGTSSAGFFFAVFDGDLEGFRKIIDGIFMTPGVVVSAGLNEVDVPVAVVQYEVLADDVDADDSELNEFDDSSDALAAEEIVSKVLLPLVIAE